MNHDSGNSDCSPTHPSVSPQPVDNSRAIWHRPRITLIDIKRTMDFHGPYFDGLAPTTSSS